MTFTKKWCGKVNVNCLIKQLVQVSNLLIILWFLRRYQQEKWHLGEAFVILAGGFGTMEESFQLLTEMSINQTAVRPVIFVGRKFYQPLFDLLRLQLKEGMISKEVIDAISLVDTAEETIELLGEFATVLFFESAFSKSSTFFI